MFLDVIPLLESTYYHLHAHSPSSFSVRSTNHPISPPATPLLITLSETYELLRLLEEITSPIISANGVDIYGHLRSLGRLLGEGEREGEKERTQRGLKQLEVVRGALARHLGMSFAVA